MTHVLSFLNKIKRYFINTLRFFANPIVIFVCLQIVSIAIIILWVFWFIDFKEELIALATALGEKNIDISYWIAVLIIGCVLLGLILIGTALLFAFAQKQSSMNRQQRNFISSVTHELKSPLASLQLSFETFQRDDLPDTIKNQLMKIVEDDIDRLDKLINRILISNQIDRSSFDIKAKDVCNFSQLINKVVEQTLYLDEKLKQRLLITCPPHITIRTSRLTISLILSNLLENAIKYSPKDKPIEINVNFNNNQYTISVKDYGFGIKSKDLKRIFKMFYRSQVATQKAISGTGLGLYILRTVIKSMGGTISAKSEGLGKGSTFTVIIPNQNRS